MLNTFLVQTFTFASGFIFFYLKSIGKYKNQKEFLKNKCKRLVVPLIITTILWIIPFHIYYYGCNLKSIFHKFILFESPNQLWFLPMLFWIFIFFNISYKKIKFSEKNLIVTFILSTLIGGFLSKLNINYFNIAKAFSFSIYFYLGGYIFYNLSKFKNKKNILLYIITFILFIYILMTANTNIIIIKYINHFIVPFFSCLEVICLYMLFNYLINKKGFKFDNRIYNLLSENSFGIYLFHQQIIYVTITIFNGLVHPIVQCILSFFISIIISLGITLILKKNKITKSLFGLY